MKQYHVTGMSCAACAARVEKAVSAVTGVTACSVSLLTNSMSVEGTASDEAVIRTVTKAGYGASVKNGSAAAGTAPGADAADDALLDRESPRLLRRLLVSLGFLLVLMYASMGHGMWGWPLPAFLSDNPASLGLTELLLSAVIMIINRKFFVSGTKSLLHGAPNMDTLVALGSSASFVWSVFALFMTTDALAKGDLSAAAAWAGEYYFESAAMILVLITVGKLLEARSKGRTTDALKSLMHLAPRTAAVLRDGKEQTIPAADVVKDDIFVVRPGESVPVDGIVLDGETAVNESLLTGESIPVDKTAGSTVSAATVNTSGFIRCRATRVGEDTTLAQIIRMVSDAAATKAPIARIADRVSGIFVPTVTAIALVTLTVWLLIGKTFDFALARAISVLVISCPCALGLATPVAIMVGSGVGAKHGVLFKTAAALEQAGRTQIVVLDKTGTVTKGTPEVAEILPAPGVTLDELLTAACALERRSEHPLAGAVLREAERRGLTGPAEAADVRDFKALPGHGLSAVVDGAPTRGGSFAFISADIPVGQAVKDTIRTLADRGCTPLLFSRGDTLLGMIAVADAVKEDSPEAVSALRRMGIQVVMLTGDNQRTAEAVGRQAGIDHVLAGVLPDGKAAVVRQLQTLGRVAMVGDGINDAPALTGADTGIAIGAGTDVAIDAADVVLINSRLSDVPAAIRLSRATLTNIRENLFWAFFYNALCIPLAAGCFVGLFGWALNPMIGAAAMSLSSFCVVSNALRLNLFRFRAPKPGRRSRAAVDDAVLTAQLNELRTSVEAQPVRLTLLIEGMMCPHCEAHVKAALEAIDGVLSAEADFRTGRAVVVLTGSPDRARLTAAVEAEDYAVRGFE